MTKFDVDRVKLASATRIGGRQANADAVDLIATPLGVGAAVIDGIGSSPTVCAAARRAADVAANIASHRRAQAGIMAAAGLYPDYPGRPNAVGAVVSVDPDGRIEIAHVGDCAVWTWSGTAGLTRWTAGQTAGQHVAHMLTHSGLTPTDRAALVDHADAVVTALDDYVLGTLVGADINKITWTPLRGAADVDLILLTSDGVHKPLTAEAIGTLVQEYADNPQQLADALVDAAVAEPRTDPDETPDNATAAVLRLTPMEDQ